MEKQEDKKCVDCGSHTYGHQNKPSLCNNCAPKYEYCQRSLELGGTCHKLTKLSKSFYHIYIGTTEVRKITLNLCEEHINSLDDKPNYKPIYEHKNCTSACKA